MRIVAVLLLSAMIAQAAERVEWERTPERFAGLYVIATLASGTRIEGNWASVTPSSFTMLVQKTSSRKDVAKGLRTIERSSIATLRAGERRSRGRVIGVAAGYFGSVSLAAVASGGSEVAGLIGFGGAIAGYFVGQSFDHASNEFLIIEKEPVPGVR